MRISRKHAIVAGVVTLIAILTLATSRRPVLVHDRSPERSAAQFLADLQKGHCNFSSEACRYVLEHRISAWKLATRQDHVGTTTLYYKLTKYGVSDAEYQLTGEGLIEVRKVGEMWHVSDYSAYF